MNEYMNDSMKRYIKTPFTYSEWFCKLRPLVLVPDHTNQLVHIDNEEYNQMKYREYLQNYRNINIEQYKIERELLHTIKKHNNDIHFRSEYKFGDNIHLPKFN